MRQLGYDQGTVMLMGELATLSVLVAEASLFTQGKIKYLLGWRGSSGSD